MTSADPRPSSSANLSQNLGDPMVRVAEQAIRMQRVTAKLSEATTVSQVTNALLTEAQPLAGSTCAAIHVVNHRRETLDVIDQIGCEFLGTSGLNIPLQVSSPPSRCASLARPIIASDLEKLRNEYPDLRSFFLDNEVHAIASFPLRAKGDVIGVWTMGWDRSQHLEEGLVVILLTLASQCALAIERAELYDRESFTSRALQRTILPHALPQVDDIATAHRYVPSDTHSKVGGDWFDALELPNNHILLVIGDVGGHDVVAAAVMGQIRNAVRSYAWEGHPVGTIMEFTNSLLSEVEPGVLATCAVVELGIDDGIANVCLAGHPPPLIIQPDGQAHFMEAVANPPLGAANSHTFVQSTLFLKPGESVALYTDGLVESRELPLETGMANLEKALLHCPAPDDVETVAASLMASATHGREVDDDMALLVLRYCPKDSTVNDRIPTRIRRTLASNPGSASIARNFTSDVIEGWGAQDVLESAELCVSELVTNALIHTATDLELVLTNHISSIEVEVIDGSDRVPVARDSQDHETSGRGLFIVETLASEWGVRQLDSGKSVWFTIDRTFDGVPS